MRDSLTPQDTEGNPDYDAFETAQDNLLADGRRVVLVASKDTQYHSRVWGFEIGIWQHNLCFDGDNHVLESTHLTTGAVRIAENVNPEQWEKLIPHTHENHRRYPYTPAGAKPAQAKPAEAKPPHPA